MLDGYPRSYENAKGLFLSLFIYNFLIFLKQVKWVALFIIIIHLNNNICKINLNLFYYFIIYYNGSYNILKHIFSR